MNNTEAYPEFCFGPWPVAAFIGILILVISPTPSKKAFNDIGVVLNARLPTHTEFCRLGSGSALGFPAEDFPSAVGAASRFCFFFCLLCSACERTTSSASSADSESDISAALRFTGEVAGDSDEELEDIAVFELMLLASVLGMVMKCP